MAENTNEQICRALQEAPQLRPFIIPNVRPTGRSLGGGSYGTVEELEIDGVLCAGKKIYDALIDRENEGAQRMVEKYYAECRLLSDLRHPHIVQFLGVCFLPDTQLPVLVMELLKCSLDELLESTPDIPYFTKLSILQDVCKGLVHLHGHNPAVIHRDLSARNVLLTSAMTAKIADMGNSRIVNIRSDQSAQTMTLGVPGTPAYMPPEALSSSCRYGPPLDMFSFGIVALFTATQVFPKDLKTPTYFDPQTNTVKGRTELERRSKYMDSLHTQYPDKNHPLVSLIKLCLHNDVAKRPTARQALERIGEMKTGIDYPYSNLSRLQLERQLKEKEEQFSRRQIDDLQQQLQSCQLEVSELQRQLQFSQREVSELQRQLQHLEQSSRREVSELLEQLKSKEEMLAVFQESLLQKDQDLSQNDREFLLLEKPNTKGMQQKTVQEQKFKVQTTRKKRAPCSMFRGSAVTTDNTIYAVPFSSHDIYCYHVKENLWSKRHNRCPQKNFGLAVFGSKLTAIGGKDASGHVTGKVLTLQQGKWIEELPPLLQPRSLPAVVSTDSHLLAIGGFTTTSGGGGCNSVELLHRGDQAWTSLTSLPTPTDFPSATLIGEHIYIMTDREHGFLSSLADVLANKKPLPLLTWQPLPPFPRTVRSYTPSSCSLGGQLVIVDSDGTIYQSLHGKWEKCGHLSGECRGLCLLASPSPHTMVAVGGGYSIYSSYVYRIGCDDEFTVDECTV